MKVTTVCPCCSAALALTVSIRIEEVGPVPAAGSGVPAPAGAAVQPGPFKKAVQGAAAASQRKAQAIRQQRQANQQPYVCSTCNQPAVPVTATCRRGENAGKRYQGMQCQTDGCPSSGGRMLSGTFRWLSDAA